jgi:hypothetical protein
MALKKLERISKKDLEKFLLDKSNFTQTLPVRYVVKGLRTSKQGFNIRVMVHDALTGENSLDLVGVSFKGRLTLAAMEYDVGQGDMRVLAPGSETVDEVQALISMLDEDSIANINDGYHSFKELYDFRLFYNAALFNELHKTGVKIEKSFKHNDGTYCFGKKREWFIVMAELPSGQISNHYPKDCWDLFKVPFAKIPTIQFDGHTSADVLERLRMLITDAPNYL